MRTGSVGVGTEVLKVLSLGAFSVSEGLPVLVPIHIRKRWPDKWVLMKEGGRLRTQFLSPKGTTECSFVKMDGKYAKSFCEITSVPQ